MALVTTMSTADRNRLLALHRRGVRIVAGVHPQADVEELYARLSILPLDVRWLLKLGLFVFKCKQADSPLCLSNLFTPLSSRYLTRAAASGKCLVPRVDTMFGVNSVTNRLTLLWNSMPSCITSQLSRKLFKAAFLDHLSKTANRSHCFILVFDRSIFSV